MNFHSIDGVHAISFLLWLFGSYSYWVVTDIVVVAVVQSLVVVVVQLLVVAVVQLLVVVAACCCGCLLLWLLVVAVMQSLVVAVVQLLVVVAVGTFSSCPLLHCHLVRCCCSFLSLLLRLLLVHYCYGFVFWLVGWSFAVYG